MRTHAVKKKYASHKPYSPMSALSAKKPAQNASASHSHIIAQALLRVVNFSSVEKNKQGAKTQRVDPPKFMTRMSETSRCKKDGGALIFPPNFSQFDHRLYLDIVHCQHSKAQFYGGQIGLSRISILHRTLFNFLKVISTKLECFKQKYERKIVRLD